MSQLVRFGRLRIGAFWDDARCWLPRFGVLNTKPFAAPPLFVQDGELTVYVYWFVFEVSLRLKHRKAQCVRGIVKSSEVQR